MLRNSTTKFRRIAMIHKPSLFGVCVLTLAAAIFAMRVKARPTTNEESEVRTLIFQWVDAYHNLDATRLAALEVQDVQVVDRFGELHLISGRNQNEKLWEDAFEIISKSTERPSVTVNCVRFLRPDVAVVQTTWQFPEGIVLTDGDRIPPFSQADTFVVTKFQSVWLIAAHNMQEKQP